MGRTKDRGKYQGTIVNAGGKSNLGLMQEQVNTSLKHGKEKEGQMCPKQDDEHPHHKKHI